MNKTQKIRVLLVEDEAITALAMNMALENMGYATCEPVATGRKALEQLALVKPDVILMDINLTGDMDGIETAHRARALGPTPIIFISGYSSNELMERAQTVDPVAIFVKPVRPQELQTAIETAVMGIENN
ncbi:MAG: response regulator [Desulfuromonadaceae bacterium]|nr:response regulator [Desulfuromonadaceae bacterium]